MHNLLYDVHHNTDSFLVALKAFPLCGAGLVNHHVNQFECTDGIKNQGGRCGTTEGPSKSKIESNEGVTRNEHHNVRVTGTADGCAMTRPGSPLHLLPP